MALHKSFRAAWPLFTALALVMAGNGLFTTLSGIRAAEEGFRTAAVGAIMSFYFGGYIAGCFIAPRLIRSAGHARAFMLVALVAAASMAAQDFLTGFYGWSGSRFATGCCYAIIYITVESWINGTSDNRVRGRMLGCYLFVVYGAMVAGQGLLELESLRHMLLFTSAALLVISGALPVMFVPRPAAAAAPTLQRLNLFPFRHMPLLGIYGVFIAGIGAGTLFTMGPVHAAVGGMDASGVARFMAAFILGGMAGQLPLGYISDQVGRRRMIAGVCLATAAALLWCAREDTLPLPALYAALFFVGAFSLNLYSQCAAYTNDRLTPEQVVDAGAAQILVHGLGAFLGPFAVSLIIDAQGDEIFFPLLSVLYLTAGLSALLSFLKRPAAAAG